MNCRAVRKQLVELFDVEPDPALQATVMAHLETCPQCSNEYEELKRTMEAVAPNARVHASPAFKETVMSRILDIEATEGAPATRQWTGKSWRIPLAAGAAVVVLLTTTLGLWLIQNRGAQPLDSFSVLGKAAHAMADLQSVHISARMRTVPGDNFSLIVLDHEFAPIDLWKRFSSPPKWRVETSGRVAVMDGDSTLLWIKPAKTAAKAGAQSGVIDWLGPLLEVDQVLESERVFAREQGSVLTLEHATGPDGNPELHVYVEAAAQGDYTNDWLRNKSITDSDNLRVYRLDADTMWLKGLQIYVHADQGDVLVFETTGIEYNATLDDALFTLDLPEGVSWIVGPEALPDTGGVADLTPEQMARAFFEACAREDWDAVQGFYPVSPLPERLKEYLGGLELVSTGAPFRSGRYPGWFVPYEVRLRDGGTKRHNLAVRNDNPAGRYVVDGGI